MTSNRPELAPITGLRRGENLPGPPARRAATSTPRELATAPATGHSAAATTVSAATRAVSRPKSAEAETTRALSLSLPVSLAEKLKAHAKAENISQADTLMDAVLAHRERLPDLLTHQQRPQARHDALFIRNAVRGGVEPYVSLSLRMKAPNVDALDDLVVEHEADSRSQLCAVALGAYLTSS